VRRELRQQTEQQQELTPAPWMAGYSAGFSQLPSPVTSPRSRDPAEQFQSQRAYLQQSVRALDSYIRRLPALRAMARIAPSVVIRAAENLASLCVDRWTTHVHLYPEEGATVVV
jgi:hypothetical protein